MRIPRCGICSSPYLMQNKFWEFQAVRYPLCSTAPLQTWAVVVAVASLRAIFLSHQTDGITQKGVLWVWTQPELLFTMIILLPNNMDHIQQYFVRYTLYVQSTIFLEHCLHTPKSECRQWFIHLCRKSLSLTSAGLRTCTAGMLFSSLMYHLLRRCGFLALLPLFFIRAV